MTLLLREDILACKGLPVAIDTETTGLHFYSDSIIGIGIHCPKAGVSGYAHICNYQTIDWGKPKVKKEWLGNMDFSKSKRGRRVMEDVFSQDTAIEAVPEPIKATHFLPAVWELVQDPETTLIGHNLKFDAHFLGIKLWEAPCRILDTAVLTHLVDCRLRKSLASAENKFLSSDSKRMHVSEADKRFNKAPWMWGEKVLEDYCTNDCVVTYQLAETLMPKIREMDLAKFLTVQMKYLRLLQKIEWRGFKVEEKFCRDAITEFDKNIAALERDLFDAVGYEFDYASSNQLSDAIYDSLGIDKPENPFVDDWGVPKKTPAAKIYTKTATGTPLLVKHDHPLKTTIIDLRESVKLKQYAEKYLILRDSEGNIHASFNPTGTITGRLSCVTGDTLLPTSRGIFRLDEYVPQQGDLVQTHTGKWQPVNYKIFQGIQPVFQVCLSNGSVLKCTHDHRVFTPNGWREIKNLFVGSEIYSYGDLEKLHSEQRQHRHYSGFIFEQSRKANNQTDFRTVGGDLPQRHVHYQHECVARKTESRASDSLLQVETLGEERYAWENRGESSQLQGTDRRRTRLSYAKGKRQICSGTSQSFCGEARARGITGRNSGASYRRESTQQQHKQSSFDDRYGTQKISCSFEVCSVTEIISLGEASTWDIGVFEDESYLAQGFISHNCSDPNLQQLAAKYRKYNLESAYTGGSERVGGYNLRQALCARSGYRIVSVDHKQQEARLLAILSNELTLLKFMAERRDIHMAIAIQVWGDCGPVENKKHREWSKATVFGICYGMSDESLQEHYNKHGIDANAIEVKYQFFSTFRGLQPWFQKTMREIEVDGAIRYWSGRYWFPYYPSEAYKGINAIIQGGAGDFLAVVLTRADQVLTATGWGYLISIIHDEALFEIKEEFVDVAAPVLASVMEGIDIFGVPFLTDIETGYSYGTLEPFETVVDISQVDWREYLQAPVLQ